MNQDQKNEILKCWEPENLSIIKTIDDIPMTTKTPKTGGAAFPLAYPDNLKDEYYMAKGMTLRDYFAAKAMQSCIDGFCDPDAVADRAYAIADAMIRAREVQS